jgi:hypothetical protein
MSTVFRTACAVVIATVLATPLFSANFSFVGSFDHDNDVQLFRIFLLSDSTVTVQTLGFGGGTNAAGQFVTAGGFESVLAIFRADTGVLLGGPIQPGVGGCAPRNPDPLRINFCQDAYAQVALSSV